MKNKGFYERYKSEQKAKEKEQKVRKKYNISDDKTVIIKEKSKIDKILFYINRFSIVILKTLLYIVLFLLSSIGATVLMNEFLRTTFFDLLKTVI